MNAVGFPTGFSLDQHVAFSQQILGPGFIENDGRLCTTLNCQRDTRRNIAANQPRESLCIGTLGSENQVYPGSTRFLRQSNDVILEITVLQYQIGKLFDKNSDIGQRHSALSRFGNIGDASGHEALIAGVHFSDQIKNPLARRRNVDCNGATVEIVATLVH